MSNDPKAEDDDVVYVLCLECGHEQPDMGRDVRCEKCGYSPMAYVDDDTGEMIQ